MNDLKRHLLAVLGLLTGYSLTDYATIAAIFASVATFAYMALCALEKWEARQARRRDAQMNLPFLK